MRAVTVNIRATTRFNKHNDTDAMKILNLKEDGLQ
jgi:hypothetical protein